MEFIHQPAPANRLGDYLKANLSTSGPWTQFRAAVAFTKRSGTKHIAPSLSAFAKVNQVEIIVGIDHRGTSLEGLSDLVEAVGSCGRLIVFHNRLPFTFHPKIYLFKSATAAEVILGSGNLTEGGLFTNYEAAFRFRLRSEALRSAGNIGDIMRMERGDTESNFEYYVEIIPKGTTQFSLYQALCTVPVRNSKKHYGYY